MLRQQGKVNAANLVVATFDNHAARRLSCQQNYLISRALVFALVEALLCFILHPEKLADAILGPSEFAQIVAATALVDFEKEVFVFYSDWAKANRVIEIAH